MQYESLPVVELSASFQDHIGSNWERFQVTIFLIQDLYWPYFSASFLMAEF